jgi:cell division septation protein DedD
MSPPEPRRPAAGPPVTPAAGISVATRVSPVTPAARTSVAARVSPGGDRAGHAPAPALWVQVGAYRSAAAAGRVAGQVQGEILVVAPSPRAGTRAEPLLRVRVGPFPDRARAAARLREIRALGYRPFIAAGD